MLSYLYFITVSACSLYAELSGGDRNVNYGNPDTLCDNGLSVQWYRITGSAGTQMLTSCLYPSGNHCNTHATGWLSGSHPTAQEGIVSRTVYFSYSGDCYWMSTSIRVLNCGGFYIYELPPTPGCQYRYCGTH